MFNPPHELEPPGETPEPGGSFQPDPVADLVDRAAFYNDLIRIAIVTAAAVALIWVLLP
jgi:hypothetical protein